MLECYDLNIFFAALQIVRRSDDETALTVVTSFFIAAKLLDLATIDIEGALILLCKNDKAKYFPVADLFLISKRQVV